MQVHGEKGTLSVTNPSRGPVVTATQNGVTSSPYFYSFDSRYKEAYSTEVNHFIDCLLDPNMKLRVTGDEVLRACKVADAATKSLHSNKPEKP